MWSIFRLQLLISVLLSSLALPTTAYPRPAATESSSVKNVVDDTAQAIHRVGVTTSVQSLESDHERATTAAAAAAATSLRPRNFPGFHEYLDIGGGWNMYYSTWPAIALPVRKYMSEMPYHRYRSGSNDIRVSRGVLVPPWSIYFPRRCLPTQALSPLGNPLTFEIHNRTGRLGPLPPLRLHPHPDPRQMEHIPAPARLHPHIRRHPHCHVLPAETDPLALRGKLRGKVAGDHPGRVDWCLSGYAEPGGVGY